VSTRTIPDALDAPRAARIPVTYGTTLECLFTPGNGQAGLIIGAHAYRGMLVSVAVADRAARTSRRGTP